MDRVFSLDLAVRGIGMRGEGNECVIEEHCVSVGNVKVFESYDEMLDFSNMKHQIPPGVMGEVARANVAEMRAVVAALRPRGEQKSANAPSDTEGRRGSGAGASPRA